MRITGFKVIKENKEHWTKHIQATVILDDDTFDIVFQFDHNKYITDIIYLTKKNYPSQLVFYRLKKCYQLIHKIYVNRLSKRE